MILQKLDICAVFETAGETEELKLRALPGYDVAMVKLNEKYVTDRAGRADVVLSRKDYRRLLEYLEDLEDRLETRKRKRGARFVSWESVKARLEGNWISKFEEMPSCVLSRFLR